MRKLTLYLILAALMGGCGMSDSADTAGISTIQAEMQIDLANPLDASPQFAVRLSTLDQLCPNARILADGANQGQNVHIEVSGLLVEPSCAGSLQLVQKDITLDIEPGDYNFSISVGNALLNSGVLSYSGDEYSLNMHTTHGLKIGHSVLKEIPEGIIWGSISVKSNLGELRQEFRSALNPITSDPYLEEGYYGHFAISQSNISDVALSEVDENGLTDLFIYRLDENTNGLQFVIDSYREQYGENINITCTSWLGESF